MRSAECSAANVYTLARSVLAHPDPNEIDPFIYTLLRRVGAFMFGGVRDLIVQDRWRVGLGADVTLYHSGLATGLATGLANLHVSQNSGDWWLTDIRRRPVKR